MPEYDAVHSQSPETYLFLGVQIKILLSHRQTGGQFTLVEGILPPGGVKDWNDHLRACAYTSALAISA